MDVLPIIHWGFKRYDDLEALVCQQIVVGGVNHVPKKTEQKSSRRRLSGQQGEIWVK
jgi:hypothetical protein